jgi:hypothetical protein
MLMSLLGVWQADQTSVHPVKDWAQESLPR